MVRVVFSVHFFKPRKKEQIPRTNIAGSVGNVSNNKMWFHAKSTYFPRLSFILATKSDANHSSKKVQPKQNKPTNIDDIFFVIEYLVFSLGDKRSTQSAFFFTLVVTN